MAKKSAKKKPGRKTEYKPKYNDIAFEFCKDGHFSARVLAKKLKVSPKTIVNWKEKYPEFAEAIEKGKDIAVDDIEQTYFKLGKGGIKTKKTKYENDGTEGEEEQMRLADETITTLAPNAQVCNRILAAHRPQTYGDEVKVGGDGTTIPIKMEFGDEEREILSSMAGALLGDKYGKADG